MTIPRPEWKSNNELPAGKGATASEFSTSVGDYKLEIKVAPSGEGDLKVNGLAIFHVDDAKNRREVFGRLANVAEQYLEEDLTPGHRQCLNASLAFATSIIEARQYNQRAPAPPTRATALLASAGAGS